MIQFVVYLDWEGTWYLWTILMYTFVFLLMCFELAQFYVLHRLYLKEIENWIEWIVFISAACTPLIKVTSESFCMILTYNYVLILVLLLWFQTIFVCKKSLCHRCLYCMDSIYLHHWPVTIQRKQFQFDVL